MICKDSTTGYCSGNQFICMGGPVCWEPEENDSVPVTLSEGYIDVDEAARERFGDDLFRRMNGDSRDD